ncbi:MAG: hypothetical protein EOP84_19520 [Verrucomicrobiaceae bacterium]|nr:MAG: hypothetical protein EOP84_19520 [Verrucomicrobiaceae bacterium]
MPGPYLCECCGQEKPDQVSPIERVGAKCEELGLTVRPLDNTVSEAAACILVGYNSDDALRKRIELGKDRLPYKKDPNGRRRYGLQDIADYLYGK